MSSPDNMSNPVARIVPGAFPEQLAIVFDSYMHTPILLPTVSNIAFALSISQNIKNCHIKS